jgi:hypothetical protein
LFVKESSLSNSENAPTGTGGEAVLAPASHTFRAYDSLVNHLEFTGLAINPDKTVLYAPDLAVFANATPVAEAQGFRCVNDGIVVCGAPVGSVDFETTHVNKVVDTVLASLDPLMQAVCLPDSTTRLQMAMRVCRLCYGSQLNHLLRAVPPRSTIDAAKRFDDAIFSTIMRLLAADTAPPGVTSPYWEAMRERALLPVSEGGFGLQKLEATAQSAFIGSLALVSNTVTHLLNLPHAEFAPLADGWGYTEARTALIDTLRVSPNLIPGAQGPKKSLRISTSF